MPANPYEPPQETSKTMPRNNGAAKAALWAIGISAFAILIPILICVGWSLIWWAFIFDGPG